jgi:hypothetical protein
LSNNGRRIAGSFRRRSGALRLQRLQSRSTVFLPLNESERAMLILVVASVLALSAVTLFIRHFAHAIPDRGEEFSIFVPAL